MGVDRRGSGSARRTQAMIAVVLLGLALANGGCTIRRLFESDEPIGPLPQSRAGLEAAIAGDHARLEEIVGHPAPRPAKGERDPLLGESELVQVARHLTALHDALDALDAAEKVDPARTTETTGMPERAASEAAEAAGSPEEAASEADAQGRHGASGQ